MDGWMDSVMGTEQRERVHFRMLGIMIGWGMEGSIIRVRVCTRRAPVSSAGNNHKREVLLNSLACLGNR